MADHWEQTISLLLDLCCTAIGSNRGKVVRRSVAGWLRRTIVVINYINIFRGLRGADVSHVSYMCVIGGGWGSCCVVEVDYSERRERW